MWTGLWVVLLAVAFMLAGCIGQTDNEDPPSESDDTDGPGTQAAQEIPVELASCGLIEAFAAVDTEKVRPHVPEDFDVATDGTGHAVVVLGGLVCGEEGTASQRGLLAILVEPVDEELSAGEGVNHFWEPEHILVEETDIAQAFIRLDSNHTRAVSVTHDADLASGEIHINAGNWSHRISTTPGVGPGNELASMFGHFREYAQGHGGYVYLDARFQGNPGDTFGTGVAEVETAEGTVSRELLGTTSQWPFLGGTGVTYADAKIGFIPRSGT